MEDDGMKPMSNSQTFSNAHQDCPGIDLAKKLTIVVTTSPASDHPDTKLIELVLKSFELVKGLSACNKVIVCDGYRIWKDCNFRNGRVDEVRLKNYEEYKSNIKKLSELSEGPWQNSKIMELQEHQGFGFAVKAALEMVDTEYVCVVQHDRTFMRPVDFEEIISAMEQQGDRVGYVLLPTSSTRNYAHAQRTRLGQYGLKGASLIDVEGYAIPLAASSKLLPCLQWYDSTHVCRTSFYRDFVFGEQGDEGGAQAQKLCCRGDFIEDRFGQAQIKDIQKSGMPAHAKWKTWLYHDGQDRAVAHLNGRTFRNDSSVAKGNQRE
eukprot:767594-Hanusia_phi.AAC.12